MRHIPVEPPAFFHRGPSPLTRLAFFVLISLSLLFLDTRYRYLENIRHVVAVALYPLQRAAQVPWRSDRLRRRLFRDATRAVPGKCRAEAPLGRAGSRWRKAR